ncbi:MAG TPA: DUF4258 domain-containing protein [Bdellovibrionota bacterium]|nr:DUF4258 domain-containing protein [Bdellovibrionota bacterium]
MTPEKVILAALRDGRFILTIHALERMQKRSVSKEDIKEVGKTATTISYQEDKGTYRIKGKDLDGEELTVICGIDQGVVIVTFF